MSRGWRIAVLGAAALAVLPVLVDVLVTTDEEAIDAQVAALEEALEDRDPDAVGAVLAASFHSEPAELRAASPQELLERLRRWWEDVEALSIETDRDARHLELAEDAATLELPGRVLVRWRWGVAVLDFRTTSRWQEEEAGLWRVAELQLLSVRAGRP